MSAPKLAAFLAAFGGDGVAVVHVSPGAQGAHKFTPILKFDRTAPDPSPRRFSHDPELYVGCGFSERLAMNAIESGLRALLDGPVHPKAFAVEGQLVWASQYTGEVVA